MTTETRIAKIRALAERGTRGGLLAGAHLGADEVHHLCELVNMEVRSNTMMLNKLRTLIEDAMADVDSAVEADLQLAHGIVIAMLEGREEVKP